MALQDNKDKFGKTFTDAYITVDRVLSVKSQGVNFSVSWYTSQADRDAGGEVLHVKHFNIDYDPNGGEPLTQAYNYLKTLPEFANATDV